MVCYFIGKSVRVRKLVLGHFDHSAYSGTEALIGLQHVHYWDKRINLGHPMYTFFWVASKKPVVFCPSIGHVAIQPKILSQNRQSDLSVPVLVILPYMNCHKFTASLLYVFLVSLEGDFRKQKNGCASVIMTKKQNENLAICSNTHFRALGTKVDIYQWAISPWSDGVAH